MNVTKYNFSIPALSIDNFIPTDSLVRAAAESFSEVEDWVEYTKEDNQIQRCSKIGRSKIPPAALLVLDYIATFFDPNIAFDEITKGAFPDTSHYGGGMMLTPNSNGEGGFLGMHIDAGIHGRNDSWLREYSAVLGISEEYDSSFDLLLHDGDSHIRVPYAFNRLNVFKCTENSWHGFPEISKGLDRKTLGVMYWSKLSDEDLTRDHVKARFNNNLNF